MRKLSIVCTLLLVLPCIALATPIPDTGQTKCYDNSQEITCPEPGEPFYGQDAQYGNNLQSYTKLDENGDDLPDEATEWVMVRDNVTGLIWEIKTDNDPPDIHDKDDSYTQQDAQDVFIVALNTEEFGGHSDWRLPMVKELSAIIDSSIPFSDPTINTDYFPNTVASSHWSSTTYAISPDNDWTVWFFYGLLGTGGQYGHISVRAVRGGQSFSNFIDNEDGTVTDTSTGLMWEVKTDDGGPRDKDNLYTWEESLRYCDTLSHAGYDDWRLPDRNKLQSLVDYSQYGPSIDTTFFPNTVSYYSPLTVSSYYRSSTTRAGNPPSRAWTVDFYHGYVDFYFEKSDYVYIRAVRGGQCGSFGDSDGDTVCDDGDNSGIPGDNPCTGGEKLNCDDNCTLDYNPFQIDCDEDGEGDVCDGDTIDNDGDGVDDGEGEGHGCDNCPQDSNPAQINSDEDNLGDVCDNCPEVSNPDQTDTDEDSIGDVCDNCPNTPNPDQLDTYPPQGNNIGDACDCEADFDCSGSVDSLDVEHFLWDFGRSEYNDPCTNERWCYGDFLCDGSVDSADVTKFLEDFGRSVFFNPCPPSEVGDWCVY